MAPGLKSLLFGGSLSGSLITSRCYDARCQARKDGSVTKNAPPLTSGLQSSVSCAGWFQAYFGRSGTVALRKGVNTKASSAA